MFKNMPTVRITLREVPAPRHSGIQIPNKYRASIVYTRRFKGRILTPSSGTYEGDGFHYWSAIIRLIRNVLTRW